jgi:predicted transcriptional regulator YdeE
MATVENIKFEKIEACRFIGKSVYARSGPERSGYIFGGMWQNSGFIFKKLDELSKYATTEAQHMALLTFDKYDETKKLLGYTVGRFMRAETPVPEGLDYFDYPEMMLAKVSIKGKFHDAISNSYHLAEEAIKKQSEYVRICEDCKKKCDYCFFEVEVYFTPPNDSDDYVLGFYIPCKAK